jgi:membrane dipeptidase
MYLKIFDAHCDVLYKMLENDSIEFNSNLLKVNSNSLINGNNNVQCFALYVPERIKHSDKFDAIIKMINIFHIKIIRKYRDVIHIKNTKQLLELKNSEVGAILTVEGCDFIEDDINRLLLLHNLGVRIYGLTWNYGNLFADGVLEPRNGGLSKLGIAFCKEINNLKSWVDVSHLNEKGFWDVINNCNYVLASHSNTKSICNNPRNLSDNQILALLEKDSWIGVTFVPMFLKESSPIISDVLKHIDKLCELGGVNNIGFGSDFDGFENGIENLTQYSQYYNLINLLLKYYSLDTVKGFLFYNFVNKVKLQE